MPAAPAPVPDAVPAPGTELPPDARVFLLLQGPHGPFFNRLAGLLRDTGAQVWRVAFNAGDEFFWGDPARLIRHSGAAEDWPAHLDALLTQKGVTDIVLYGDVRPVHAAARAAAAARGLRLHAFEEGYLRPYWITYERGGSNGYSRLMQIDLARMTRALRGRAGEVRRPPAHWGDMRQHKFYSVLYHAMVALRSRAYPGFRSHRDETIPQEALLNLRRFLRTPLDAIARRAEAARVSRGGFPYVIVLLQLAHDSSFRAHSDYPSIRDFLAEVMESFARAAPRHHRLVFKTHPLEDDRARLREAIADLTERLGLRGRVHLVRGGKLAPLIAQARAAVTVNSTAAQQAMWRGLPVRALGRAVYSKPGLVSMQPLDDFFRTPERPLPQDYAIYRDYLLETSQVPGGFYARRSRAVTLRLVVDMMLAPLDPYDALETGGGTYRQQPGAEDR